MAIHLDVGEADKGSSLINFLQRSIPAASVGYLNQLIRKGKVKQDGEVLETRSSLIPGQQVVLSDSGRLRDLIELSRKQPPAPVVLFENSEILIVDKPSGLAVHASSGHEEFNLTDQLQKRAMQHKDKFKIAPVQRLDLETSGVILFGKGRKALADLGQLLMNRQLKKTYLALVKGDYQGSEELVSEVLAKGKIKLARCRIKVLQRSDAASLLEIELLTGRQHQIRQQLSDQGHPLYGDRRYRGPCPDGLTRIFLHSYRLSFHSPFGGEPVEVVAELPAELKRYLEAQRSSGTLRS
jgi:RluA family pseudouridine synthase